LARGPRPELRRRGITGCSHISQPGRITHRVFGADRGGKKREERLVGRVGPQVGVQGREGGVFGMQQEKVLGPRKAHC